MKEAIIKAQEAGYKLNEVEHTDICCVFTDPLFWQALGKAEGWGETISAYENAKTVDWKWYMHSFTDHLISGKPIDAFFEELLTK